MLFRSAKFSLGLSASLLFLGSLAYAELTIIPQSPYTLVSNTLYLASSATNPEVDTGSGFHSFNFNVPADSDPDQTEGIRFELATAATDTLQVTGSQRVAIVAYGSVDSGEARPIPMVILAGGSGQVQSLVNGSTTTAFPGYFAVRPTIGQNLTVAIYLKDACRAITTFGVQGTACTVENFREPSPGARTTMTVTFYLRVVADENNYVKVADTTEKSATVTLNIQAGEPLLTCPSMGSLYFPGDNEIEVDPGVFLAASSQYMGNAPLDTLYLAATENSPPDTSSLANASAKNPIFQTMAIDGSKQAITGFTNSTSTETHSFNAAFAVRDRAGAISNFGCSLAGIQTSSIQGFLNKSNCFIATAAFRSADASPVMLLREFRDEVLLKTTPGRLFVKAYYKNSPAAAEWLIKHPAFRHPVLLALIPLQVAAWFLLHPSWLAALLLMSLALMSFVVFPKGARR